MRRLGGLAPRVHGNAANNLPQDLVFGGARRNQTVHVWSSRPFSYLIGYRLTTQTGSSGLIGFDELESIFQASPGLNELEWFVFLELGSFLKTQ